LGLDPELERSKLPIRVRVVPLDTELENSLIWAQFKQCVKLTLVQPSPLKIKNEDNLSAQCEVQSVGGYIEWNFTCNLTLINTKIKVQFDKIKFQLALELGDYFNGEDLAVSKFPGGNSIEELYLLSLYSLPIQVVSKPPSPTGKIIPIPFTSDADCDLERISHERRFYMKAIQSNKYVRLLEIPLGRDLGSHGWDCSYIGLQFLQSILFENIPTELNISKNCNVNEELVSKIKTNLLPKLDSNGRVKIIELGVGVGLFSLGLSETFKLYHESKAQSSKTKLSPWKYEFILTDLPIILNGTRRQMVANPVEQKPKAAGYTSTLTPMVLDWEEPITAENSSTLSNLNWIFAYDVVYNNTAHKPLLNTLLKLTEDQDPLIILGYKVRNKGVEQDFFKMCKPYFKMEKLVTYYQIHLILVSRKRD
jgi:hypothetical protein